METVPRRSPILEPAEELRLVQAAQGGDQAAFAEIVRHFQRPIYRVAWSLTRNSADADDLAQETFVRAWQALARFRAGEPLYPWLARIAVNQAFSLHRRRKRRPETSIEPLVESGRQWAGEDDPAENAAGSERKAHLRACFAELSPEHQAVLTLRVVEGMTYDEIAETIGVPVGTVMSRLSRARADLKTRLAARTGEKQP